MTFPSIITIIEESALITFLVVIVPMYASRIVGYFMALNKKRRNSKTWIPLKVPLDCPWMNRFFVRLSVLSDLKGSPLSD